VTEDGHKPKPSGLWHRNCCDVNLLGANIDTIKRNTQTLTDTNKTIGLEVNTEKTKYMLLSCHQNAGQNHDIKIGNRYFENVAQFGYLGTMIIISQKMIIIIVTAVETSNLTFGNDFNKSKPDSGGN
jgi:hypothetical protein